MTDAPAPSTWAELRANKPAHDEALVTTPAGKDRDGRELLFGIDRRSELHLLLPVDGGPIDGRPADLQGLRVRHRLVGGGLQYLDLTASPAYERLFSPLVGEILTAVIECGRNPWSAVSAIIRAWQSAWRPMAPNMPKTVQVGLFGELLTLERIMIPALGPTAVHSWSGPEAERHDFVGKFVHLEVKTTRKSRHEHEISRIDQLDPPEGRRLMVISVLLEESLGGLETVASKMDEVVDLIRLEGAASDAFQAKMVQLGWSDELRRSGELLQFNLRDALIYEVNDTFPRLPTGFRPPEGVVALKYTVDLANIPSIGSDEAVAAIRGE